MTDQLDIDIKACKEMIGGHIGKNVGHIERVLAALLTQQSRIDVLERALRDLIDEIDKEKMGVGDNYWNDLETYGEKFIEGWDNASIMAKELIKKALQGAEVRG